MKIYTKVGFYAIRLTMKKESEEFAYMMAAEKMVSMLCLMEQTINFMEEYSIKPDEQVKMALNPMIDQLRKWLDGK